MKKITIQDTTYEVPGEWDEFTRDQLLYLIRLIRTCKSEAEITLKLLLFCIKGSIKSSIGPGMHLIKTRASKHVLFVDEVTALLDVFEFLFEDYEGEKTITPKLTTNYFKKIRSGIRTLIGPNDLLQDITYNQFVHLQTYQAAMVKDPDAIDDLVSVLYKSRKGKQNVKWMKRVKPDIKIATLWFYLGTLAFLEEMFPRVFAGGSKATGSVYDNQQRIIDVMAGGDVTKKEKVRESFLYDAMYSMEMAAARMEEMERQSSKS